MLPHEEACCQLSPGPCPSLPTLQSCLACAPDSFSLPGSSLGSLGNQEVRITGKTLLLKISLRVYQLRFNFISFQKQNTFWNISASMLCISCSTAIIRSSDCSSPGTERIQRFGREERKERSGDFDAGSISGRYAQREEPLWKVWGKWHQTATKQASYLNLFGTDVCSQERVMGTGEQGTGSKASTRPLRTSG